MYDVNKIRIKIKRKKKKIDICKSANNTTPYVCD